MDGIMNTNQQPGQQYQAYQQYQQQPGQPYQQYQAYQQPYQSYQQQPGQPCQQQPYQQYQAPAVRSRNLGKTGFALGLASVILLPLFYNPFMLWIVWIISIIGLAYSIKGLKAAPRGFAIAGLVLSAFPIASHFIMWALFWV